MNTNSIPQNNLFPICTFFNTLTFSLLCDSMKTPSTMIDSKPREAIEMNRTLPTIIHFSAIEGSVFATENVSLSKRPLFYSKRGFFAELPHDEPYLIQYLDTDGDICYVLPPKKIEWYQKDRRTPPSSYMFLRESHQSFNEYMEYILSQELIPFEP